MTDKRCKCPMAISLTGDGCRYCQPQEYIDRLHEAMEDDEAELGEQAEARVAELEGTLYNASLQKTKLTSAYILRKQAEAVDEVAMSLANLVATTFEESEALAYNHARLMAYETAHRLRQQADELEETK